MFLLCIEFRVRLPGTEKCMQKNFAGLKRDFAFSIIHRKTKEFPVFFSNRFLRGELTFFMEECIIDSVSGGLSIRQRPGTIHKSKGGNTAF
ncbi:MAG: hypothetical protein EGQ26_05130 [Clostridiales bacterium]|nr:hypothetical protein [Clostridiales bacterium]